MQPLYLAGNVQAIHAVHHSSGILRVHELGQRVDVAARCGQEELARLLRRPRRLIEKELHAELLKERN